MMIFWPSPGGVPAPRPPAGFRTGDKIRKRSPPGTDEQGENIQRQTRHSLKRVCLWQQQRPAASGRLVVLLGGNGQPAHGGGQLRVHPDLLHQLGIEGGAYFSKWADGCLSRLREHRVLLSAHADRSTSGHRNTSDIQQHTGRSV